MDRRLFLIGAASMSAVGVIGGCALTPASPSAYSISPIDPGEHSKTIEALKPPKRKRPVIAVVVDKEGSETTDTIVPHAVLSLSGLADVHVVAASSYPVELFPALTIVPQMTFEDFDDRYREGADYVIVPASHRIDSPKLVPWIAQQAGKNATVIGICAGARTVAAAGLLRGRRGTTHWYEVEDLLKEEPGLIPVTDRRYVVDDGIVTTTGVTASIPVSLALVEAIGGFQQAEALASRLGVSSWTAAHNSEAFSVTREAVWAAISGRVAFWNRQSIGIPVESRSSAIALALTADAWARTDRSRTIAIGHEPRVELDSGLALADLSDPATKVSRMVEVERGPAARALDETLAAISTAYGEDVARYVAIQVEYAWAEGRS
ncbi:DJ-1/PfpI family protein [Erythrobacter litoralis]|uniref:DJ-1/PfpI domain-containing protein n=1 Tax=Erythrobacter litoralis TaxID=39960 RepID=A0A074MA89_9SPHN|nr:DJ-1/PfpI family protein [Erythrobacter litoralis]AOL22357.1 DJ-1/PfpI family protein [Erythrobacter litoralis]KEO89645.1 hypothetical protein EH32_03845 [Erythrobacter litoralis]